MTLLRKKLLTASAILLGLAATATIPALQAQQPPLQAPAGAGLAPMDEDIPELLGEIQGNQYLSPTGAFRATIPILPFAELGSEISDTANVVTFQDAFGTHVSIGCFRLDAKLREEETKRGRKEFLVWFFQTYVQADFTRSVPGTNAEPNAKFINSTQDGTLFTLLNLPNGSVFSERVFIFPPKTPVIAKRGNFVFVNDNNIYVLSTELSERIFEHDSYKKTPAEEEEILRHRLFDILNGITFAKRAAAAPATAPAATTAPAASAPTISFPGATQSDAAGKKP